MSTDELRLRIAELIRDELELDVRVQGKRLVVTEDDDVAIILVSAPRASDPRASETGVRY